MGYVSLRLGIKVVGLLLVGLFVSGQLKIGIIWAQESDTDVPIVNVGGRLHADPFTGQATMSIPLDVLPGRQGLQPDLALVYGSANGNGWTGMGWKLEKGVIERQLKFGVDYNADDYVFRLNGVNVELVNIGGDEYRAKIEGGFTRIQKKSGAEGLYFEATDRYGTTYTFGETARVADPEDSDRVFRWCLERVEDTHGNYMTFSYVSPDNTNQAYLVRIAYTGHDGQGLNPTTTVEFELEDRSDAPTLYTTHFPMTTTKRLKKVVMKAPGGEVMRSYQLAYHATLSSSGRSLLESVTQCGRPRDNGDGTVTETCLPRQTFTYRTPSGVAFTKQLHSLPLGGMSCSTGSGCRGRNRMPQGPIGPSDVDGNGRVELLGANRIPTSASALPPEPDSEGTTPLLHTLCNLEDAESPDPPHPDGPLSPAPSVMCTWNFDSYTSFTDLELPDDFENTWAPTNQLTGLPSLVRGTPDHRLAEGPTGFADVTGNGATEVYQWDFDGTIDLHIPQLEADQRVLESWVSRPDVLTWDTFATNTDPQELNYRIGFADIDGDGQADFWGRQGSTVKVRLANDYNAATQTQTFATAQTFTWAAIGPLGSPMGFADVSGDGEADFWGWRADGDLEIRLSRGDGTFGAPVIFDWVNDPNRERPLGFADINGDGLADFWGWALVTDGPYIAGYLYYALAHGDGSFGTPQSLYWADPPVESTPPDPETDVSLLGRIGFADINSDGKADLYGWKPEIGAILIHLTEPNGTVNPLGQGFTWDAHAATDGPIGFADITGNGIAEFYGWRDSGWNGQVQIFGSEEEKPDLLVGVENGLGGAWTIVYVSTADSAHSFEQTQLPFALPIVETVSVDDGNGNVSPTTYGVTEGYYHLEERDFRGFHLAEMVDPKGIRTNTWFHQGNDVAVDVNDPAVPDGYLKGAIYRETVTGGNGVGYGKTETNYQADTGGPPFFTPPKRHTQWRCGEDGACQQSHIDWDYDAYGNPTQEIHSGDVTVSGDERTVQRQFTPNLNDWLIAYPTHVAHYSGAGGGTQVAQTLFVYDGGSGAPTQGNLTKEIRWGNGASDVTTAWTYDALGNRLTQREANTATTTWTYDPSQTFVLTETNALNHAPIRTAYYGVAGETIDDGLYGQLKQVIDANNNMTRTAYDRLGRVTRVTHPDGLFTDTAYQHFGQGVGIQRVQTYWEHTNAPNDQVYLNSVYGEHARQYFDGLGRVIRDEQPGTELNYERITDMTYDARGLMVIQSLPHFRVSLNPSAPNPIMTFTYDGLGRVETISQPDGRVERLCYGGGVTATIDANGHKRRTVRDPFGQVVKVQEFEGDFSSCTSVEGSPYATTRYGYDALGNLTGVTDAAGNVTTMLYDSLSRKTQMDDPDMGTWTYDYDAVGNLIKQTDAENHVLHFQYDLLNRRVQKDYVTAKPSGSGDIMWTYDGATPNGIGRLTKVEHTTASIPSATEYGYDRRGRVIQKTETIGAQTFTFHQTYDGLDRETSMTYPDGTVVQKKYYGAYLSQVREPGGVTYATVAVSPNPLGYTPQGQPMNLATGNGVATAYTYDANTFRLITLKTTRCDRPICTPDTPGAPNPLPPVTLQDLAYGYDAGGNVTSITDPQHGNQSFVYDDLDRLKQATVGAVARTHTYDVIGNMTSHSQVGTYTYPPSGPSSVRPHAVITAGPYAYTYDANGNMMTGANRTIVYDQDNRPVTITSTGYGEGPEAPTITQHPINRTVPVGQPVTFQVAATGTAPLRYQWKKNDAMIGGANGTSYTVGSPALGDSGTVFTVDVSNPAGSVTSAQATLTVVPTLTLNVALDGAGSGTVSSQAPGISCPNDCAELYPQGTLVTLSATAKSDSSFRGWSGACTGAGTCVVTMTKVQQVTATFGKLLAHWPLEGDADDATGQGRDGDLIGSPTAVTGRVGNALQLDGSNDYVDWNDQQTTLTAGRSEFTLSMWVKPDTWENARELYSEDHSVNQIFNTTVYPQNRLSPAGWVTRDSTTSLTGSPDNTVDLPDLSGELGTWHHLAFVYSVSQARKAVYLDGVLVDSTNVSIDPLTTTRDFLALGSGAPSGFLGGTPDPTRYAGILDEVMLFAAALTEAEIQALAGTLPVGPHILMVAVSGTGTVTSQPPGIICPGTCDAVFAHGTPVTLIAATDTAHEFSQWSLPGCPGTGSCALTMDQAQSVTATIVPAPYMQGASPDYLVSMEAEHADVHTPRSNQEWKVVTPSGVSGREALQILPDQNTKYEVADIGNSPQLSYRIKFVQPGTYTVWVRGQGVNGAADSMHVGLNGQGPITLTGFLPSWTWSQASIVVSTVGEQTLEVWAREDGFVMDKLILTQDDSFIPADVGPEESVHGGSGPASHALTVSVSGNGSVTSTPAGINCPTDCAEEYVAGTPVTLTADPAQDHVLQTWGRACSGTGACVVTMSQAQSVSATFVASSTPTHILTVSVSGNGSVTSNPSGINCGSDCTETYNSGTQVTLTAVEASGSTFSGWSGAGCSGTGTCIVTMTQAQNATATFALVGPTTHTLNVARNGSGSGTVTSTPAGINCGSDCSQDYDDGTVVDLTAAASGFFNFFTGWSGACSGSLRTCQVTMTQAKSVTATFSGLFGATEPAATSGHALWVKGIPDEAGGGRGINLASGGVAANPARLEVVTTGQSGETVRPALNSGYIHFATFRSSITALPSVIQKVTAERETKKHQLDKVLVRTQAASPDGTVTTFVYNGEGERVVKQVEAWVTVYVGRDYVCHGTERAVRHGGDLSCAKLIYANGKRVAMVQVDTGKATYFHQDHLGSTRVVTDANGTVEQDLAYYPFGETRVNASNRNVDIAYKYTGQELDDTTGLYDYHARLYDPLLRRFTQPDTIVPEPFNPQAFNRYSYVLNNPLKYIDPTGREAIPTLPPVIVTATRIPPPPTRPSDYNPALQAHSVSTVQNSSPFKTALPSSGGRRRGTGPRNKRQEVLVAKNPAPPAREPIVRPNRPIGNAFQLPSTLENFDESKGDINQIQKLGNAAIAVQLIIDQKDLIENFGGQPATAIFGPNGNLQDIIPGIRGRDFIIDDTNRTFKAFILPRTHEELTPPLELRQPPSSVIRAPRPSERSLFR